MGGRLSGDGGKTVWGWGGDCLGMGGRLSGDGGETVWGWGEDCQGMGGGDYDGIHVWFAMPSSNALIAAL